MHFVFLFQAAVSKYWNSKDHKRTRSGKFGCTDASVLRGNS